MPDPLHFACVIARFAGQSEAANWRKSAVDDGEAVALLGCGTKEHTMSADELLNVVDAANYLGIRPWTLRHWVSDGKIEIVKYDNGIDRFVASCTIKARQ